MVRNRARFLIKEHNYHFQYKTFLQNPFFPELNADVIDNFRLLLGARDLKHLHLDKRVDIEERCPGHRLINFIDNRFTGIFGHTICKIDDLIIIYGGLIQTGSHEEYCISGTTYVFCISLGTWAVQSLQRGSPKPAARYFHTAAVAGETPSMVVYGGRHEDGELSDDSVYTLEPKWDRESKWIKLKTVGRTPGPRSGHSMLYTKPMLIVYGGESPRPGPLSSQVWMLDLSENKDGAYEWMALKASHLSNETGSLWPALCVIDPVPNNKDNDIIIFGGMNPYQDA